MRNLVTFSRLGRHGRFANQLYQVAGTIGIARRSNMDFAFPFWANHNGKDFEPDLDADTQSRFVNSLPVYGGPPLPEIGVAWGFSDVRLTHSVDILGHFQSEKYFSHAIDEIKWYFRMKDEPPLNDYVAIHFRAGDYGDAPSPQHPQGNSYHPRMDLRYYEPAMALFPNRKFLVFSDDIPKAKEMFGNKVEYSEGRDYLDDFRLMKRCHSFIIANSSYSAMAAVLGDAPGKKVVAPRPWFGGMYDGQIDGEDIYGEGWTIINWLEQAKAA